MGARLCDLAGCGGFERQPADGVRSGGNLEVDEPLRSRSMRRDVPLHGCAGVPEDSFKRDQTEGLLAGAMVQGERQAEVFDPVGRLREPGAAFANVGLRRVGERFDECGDEPDLGRGELVEPVPEFLEGHEERSRRSIRSTYPGLSSMPAQVRPSSWAARSVVPDPA